MQNIMKMTDFIRFIGSCPVGFSTLYLVPANKSYGEAQRNLSAIACRAKVAISMAQVLLSEPGQIVETAIRVTKK